MHKFLFSIAAACLMAGCATAPSSTPREVRADPALQALKPGPTYIASFPEADRRAACDRLKYRTGTMEYSRCLEGYFPDNPYLQAGN
jgi:hypothetical protein